MPETSVHPPAYRLSPDNTSLSLLEPLVLLNIPSEGKTMVHGPSIHQRSSLLSAESSAIHTRQHAGTESTSPSDWPSAAGGSFTARGGIKWAEAELTWQKLVVPHSRPVRSSKVCYIPIHPPSSPNVVGPRGLVTASFVAAQHLKEAFTSPELYYKILPGGMKQAQSTGLG